MREPEIGRGNKRRVQKKKARRNRFSKTRQEAFLSHFAATCNASASAKKAGVGISTVYMRRMGDPEFQARYAAALDQGYATLEAEMVRRATAALTKPIEPDPDGLAATRDIDPKVALSLLQLHRKGIERGLGNTVPRRSDIEQARARLEKRMRALGLIGEEVPPAPSRSNFPAKAGEDDPSTASRSPSPAKAGEE